MDHSILYVDIENLQENAKGIVLAALDSWPEDFPRPFAVKLYAKADNTEMWRIWASHNIPSVEIVVQGVQHFTFTGSKNSADIALSLDALSDLLKGRAQQIAILSDDSDFATLFAKIRLEMDLREDSTVPFKWFMTDRPDTRSMVLRDFLPEEYIHTVAGGSTVASNRTNRLKPVIPTPKPIQPVITAQPAPKPIQPVLPALPSPIMIASSEKEEIAKAVITNIRVGSFNSADCKKIIAQYFPSNPLGKQNSAQFGTQFSKDIWPILEKYGVLLPNPNRKPRKYEMTEEAKKQVE